MDKGIFNWGLGMSLSLSLMCFLFFSMIGKSWNLVCSCTEMKCIKGHTNAVQKLHRSKTKDPVSLGAVFRWSICFFLLCCGWHGSPLPAPLACYRGPLGWNKLSRNPWKNIGVLYWEGGCTGANSGFWALSAQHIAWALLKLLGIKRGAFLIGWTFSPLAQTHQKSGCCKPLYKAGPTSFSVDNLIRQRENEITCTPFFKAVTATLVRWSYFRIIRIFKRNQVWGFNPGYTLWENCKVKIS